MFKLHGSVPPMITPFTQDGRLDIAGLETLVTFLADKVHGLFITGSYGAGPMMSLAERKQTAEVTIKTAKGKVPVIVMVGSTNNKDSVELAKHAQAAGAKAVAAVGPFYFTHKKDSICYFFEDLVKAVDIPVYLYNNPNFQGYEIDVDTVKACKEVGVKGIKDATFNIMTHAAYQRLLKDNDFDIALGTEAMWLSARVLGCEAFIPGLGNVFPELMKKLFDEGMSGDLAACRDTQFLVNKIRDIMYLARSTQLAVYAMLEIRGVLKAYPRAPFIPASDEEKRRIREQLAGIGMLGD